MRTPAGSFGTRRSDRLLGGVALIAFLGAFFAVPLWAALTLCTMPCCSHDSGSGPATAMVADMSSGCQTECSIETPSTRETAVPVVVAAHDDGRPVSLPSTIAFSGEITKSSFILSLAATPVAHGVDAPIHVLNSTFRI